MKYNIDDLKNIIYNFINIIPNEPNEIKKDKGVVICAGSNHFVSSVILINLLIKKDPNVYIEWYYVGDELIDFQINYLKTVSNINLRNCLDIIPKWFGNIPEEHIKGFMIKPFALMVSEIENILLIDGDNMPVFDINTLFENENYIKYGNIFWLDLLFSSEETNKQMMSQGVEIYEKLGIQSPMDKGFNLAESGQVVVNKIKCWKALCLSYFLNFHYKIFYSLFFGDKDLYYIAFQFTNTEYYQSPYYPHGISTEDKSFAISNTIIQRHPNDGSYGFIHRTLSKLSINKFKRMKYIYHNLDYPLNDYKDNSQFIVNTNDKLNPKCTFVTCFYDIGRDKYENKKQQRDNKLYHGSFNIMLMIKNLDIIVFTDEQSYDDVKTVVDKSHTLSKVTIIKLELEELKHWSYLNKIKEILVSDKYKELIKDRDNDDIEIYKPKYTCLMNCKIDLLKYVYDNNLNSYDNIVWIDYGYVRIFPTLPKDNVFVLDDNLLDETKIVMNLNDMYIDDTDYNMEDLIRTGYVGTRGAPICVHKNLIDTLYNEYDKLFIENLNNGLVDDDQSYFYLMYKNLDIIKTYYDEKINWFTLLTHHNNVDEQLVKYLIPHELVEFENFIYSIYENVVKLYYNNIDAYISFLMKEINKCISFEGHDITVNNEGMYSLYLTYLLQVQDKFTNLILINNLVLLDHFYNKRYHDMFEMYKTMYIKNVYDDTTVIIIIKLMLLHSYDSLVELINHTPDKYKLFVLTYLLNHSKIEENKLETLFDLTDGSHTLFLNKCKNFVNYKNYNNVEKTLDYLIQHKDIIPQFSYPFFISMFYKLSFNDNNNKELRTKVSQFHRLVCPSLNYVNDDMNEKFNNNNIGIVKKRIGFISTNFYMHSVGRDRTGVIRNLNKDLYDVIIFHFKDHGNDIYYQKLQTSGHTNVILQGRFEDWIKVIQAYKLDIIVYPDLSMQYQTYCLAHTKLAPVQLTTWGHSETSGIDTIDYYISSVLYETNKAQKFYSEKLIQQQSLCTYYYNCYYDFIYNAGDENFIKDANVNNIKYLVYSQYLHKISNYDFDLFKQIINKNKDIKIILVNGTGSENDLINTQNRLADYMNNIIIFNRMKTGNLYKLVENSLFVLDSYPHGGCNTSLEAFNYNKVIVTRPSDYLRGRFTVGFYKKMNINDCIVNNTKEYIKLVSKLINDNKYLKSLEKRIKNNKHKLFNDNMSLCEWNDLFTKI